MENEQIYQTHLSSRSGPELPRCPFLKVVRTNEFGMVVESQRSFEIGEEMTIGFHVSGESAGNSFISAESLVVGSERQISDRGDFLHRVTLLFSNVASADRERLIALSKSWKANFSSPCTGLN